MLSHQHFTTKLFNTPPVCLNELIAYPSVLFGIMFKEKLDIIVLWKWWKFQFIMSGDLNKGVSSTHLFILTNYIWLGFVRDIKNKQNQKLTNLWDTTNYWIEIKSCMYPCNHLNISPIISMLKPWKVFLSCHISTIFVQIRQDIGHRTINIMETRMTI